MTGGQAARNTTNLYRTHGDEQPNREELVYYIQNAEIARTRTPSFYMIRDLLFVADMHIDLAVADPENTHDHIQDAREKLEEVADCGATLKNPQSLDYFDEFTGVLAIAHLRTAELLNWRRAAQGREVTSLYRPFLSAMAAIPEYAWHTNRGKAVFAEAVVLLAGAENPELGWFGRLALTREDRRRNKVKKGGKNPNWDCGITLDRSATSYQDPPVKIQVKKVKGREGYDKVVLKTRENGFENSALVAGSHVSKAGISLPFTFDKELYSNDKLAEIRDMIHDTIKASELPSRQPV